MQMTSTLDELLCMIARRTRIWYAASDSHGTSESICSSYDDEGYASMLQDSVRNRFFCETIKHTRGANWLEVGPGAHALLTMMALTNSSLNTLVAIEANAASAAKARKVLKCHQNFVVETGYSTTYQGPKPVDVVLSEIIGVIASSEGVCAVMNDLRRRGFVTRTTKLVPARAATFITPVQLGPVDINRGGDVYISQKMLLLRGMNVERVSLANDVGVLESLDFGGLVDDELTQHSTLVVTRTGKCHGFGMFIGIASPTPCRRYTPSKLMTVRDWHSTDMWITSDCSDSHYASNWRNPVMILESPLHVVKCDILELTCTVHDATSVNPSYSLSYTLNGVKQATLTLSYADLYPTFQKVESLAHLDVLKQVNL